MICIHIKNTDPFFSLAAEEYLLKNFEEDIFLLWQSNNTIVVGKHQNALAEINYRFVRENDITIARRISGGGTVFHDSGNVNFAYIKSVKSHAEISFQKFTKPMVQALANLGVEASSSGRNDLMVNGFKISGNAEHVFKNRVLHHGTLLYHSNLKNLGKAIKVIPGRYAGKAVQSNRSKVANISSFLSEKMSTRSFIQFLFSTELEKKGHRLYELNEFDNSQIKKLLKNKFSTWDWRYGYSPKYSFQNRIEKEERFFEINLYVVKGRIAESKISGNLFPSQKNKFYAENFLHKRHCYDDVSAVLSLPDGEMKEEIIYSFF